MLDPVMLALLSKGGGLPEVTAADEGAVLRVNAEGKWAAEKLQNAEEVSV